MNRIIKKRPGRVVGFLAGIALILSQSFSLAAEEPVKVGILNPYSGPFAVYGEEHEEGVKLYYDKIAWKIAGRSIEIISEDTEAKPSEALQKARKLIEKDRVNFIIGLTSSGVAIAIRDYVHSMKTPLIISSAAGHDILSLDKRSKYLFRANYAYATDEYPIGDYIVNVEGKKRVIILSTDYIYKFVYHVVGTAIKQAGGEIAQTFSFPFGTTDFLPYFGRLEPDQADAIFVFCAGSDAVRFVTQWAETGMKRRIKLFGDSHLVSTAVLQQQGDAAVGIICTGHWFPEIATSENVAFKNEYKKKHGKEPSYVVEHGYTVAQVISEALKARNGDTKNLDSLLAAMQDVRFNAPRGPFRFEKENNTVINTIYVSRIVKRGESYGYEILKTIPNSKFSDIVPIVYPGYKFPK
jgi:branched-chain amino acid transport system substrate-binding protein